VPANVAAASPSGVLPEFIGRSFVRSQSWPVRENEYIGDGTRQSVARTTTPTVSWELEYNVEESVRAALWSFLETKKFITPFYFYDFTEGAHDPSGSSSVGRYVVVAVSPLGFSQGPARALMSLRLEQRA
jgi:hypothetical protein